MAFVFDATAQHCRFLGVPIPFCYSSGTTGNRAPADPDNGAPSGGSGPPPVELGFGGVAALGIIGLVVVLVVVNKLGRL